MKTNRKDYRQVIRAYLLSMLSLVVTKAVSRWMLLYNYSYRWNWDSDSCHLLNTNPFDVKYHQTKGTHCWFCDREFGFHRQVFACGGSPLIRTREHIIPRSFIGNHPLNYVASCKDCNLLKGQRNAKEFAIYLEELIISKKQGFHNMWKLFPIMKNRAWKLYNKTSKFHIEYEQKGFEKAKNRLLKKYQS